MFKIAFWGSLNRLVLLARIVGLLCNQHCVIVLNRAVWVQLRRGQIWNVSTAAVLGVLGWQSDLLVATFLKRTFRFKKFTPITHFSRHGAATGFCVKISLTLWLDDDFWRLILLTCLVLLLIRVCLMVSICAIFYVWPDNVEDELFVEHNPRGCLFDSFRLARRHIGLDILLLSNLNFSSSTIVPSTLLNILIYRFFFHKQILQIKLYLLIINKTSFKRAISL